MKTDLKQIDGESVDWTYLALDKHIWRAVVNPVMNVRVLLIFELFCEYLKNYCVGRTVVHTVRILISWLIG